MQTCNCLKVTLYKSGSPLHFHCHLQVLLFSLSFQPGTTQPTAIRSNFDSNSATTLVHLPSLHWCVFVIFRQWDTFQRPIRAQLATLEVRDSNQFESAGYYDNYNHKFPILEPNSMTCHGFEFFFLFGTFLGIFVRGLISPFL